MIRLDFEGKTVYFSKDKIISIELMEMGDETKIIFRLLEYRYYITIKETKDLKKKIDILMKIIEPSKPIIHINKLFEK